MHGELPASKLVVRHAGASHPKALLVHPGTQHSFHLARQLERHCCLARFWTGLAFTSDSLLGQIMRCAPARAQRRLMNRRVQGVATSRLRTRPLIECRALRRLQSVNDEQKVFFERNSIFQHSIPRHELSNSDVVIGFDTSSWLIGERAIGLGRPFVLDQSSPHPLSCERIVSEFHRQFPNWANEFPRCLPQFLAAEQTEHELSYRIVVASSFSRKTLIENGVAVEKIVVIPYGVDLTAFFPICTRDLSRPLRFIFIGNVCAHKGIPLLLKVWHSLQPTEAELWLVGPASARVSRLIPRSPGLRVLGKVPHCELPALLRKCDVLVLPSYFEGFGLVLLEALASGLPIIATEATAAPDLITNGVEGYIIPVGDLEALRDALLKFINLPDDLARMSRAARRCAERYSWDAYGDRWLNILQQVV